MANELTHKDPGAELTQAEYITSDGTGHVFESQATGDILYASSATVLSRLAKATDGNIMQLASGLPAWTASPTIGATNWGNATHAHAASNSGGTIAITAATGTLLVASGGTGVTSLTDKAVLISQDCGTDAVGSVALTTDGQIIVGGSGGPAAATITAGSGISVTNGANSITVANSLSVIIALS